MYKKVRITEKLMTEALGKAEGKLVHSTASNKGPSVGHSTLRRDRARAGFPRGVKVYWWNFKKKRKG